MTRSSVAKIRGPLHPPAWRTSPINHPDVKNFGPSCPDSPSRRKHANALWKLAHLWKSIIGGLRQLLLDDFHRCLEKSLAKTLGLFHSYTQRQRRLTYSMGEKCASWLTEAIHFRNDFNSSVASLRPMDAFLWNWWWPSVGIAGGIPRNTHTD
jgi:hypothetical protein